MNISKYNVKEKFLTVKHYVSIIKELNNDMLNVRFVKIKYKDKNSTTFVYPTADSIDEIFNSNIVCCLPQLPVWRKSQLTFGITFNEFNLKM